MIVMAYCEGGDLCGYLKGVKDVLDEQQLVEWLVQICMALQYLHARNILHRDLKTQNIFLTSTHIIKLGDLGIARVLDSASDLATTVIGTPYYMSPELFRNVPYGKESDVWALGNRKLNISQINPTFFLWALNVQTKFFLLFALLVYLL